MTWKLHTRCLQNTRKVRTRFLVSLNNIYGKMQLIFHAHDPYCPWLRFLYSQWLTLNRIFCYVPTRKIVHGVQWDWIIFVILLLVLFFVTWQKPRKIQTTFLLPFQFFGKHASCNTQKNTNITVFLLDSRMAWCILRWHLVPKLANSTNISSLALISSRYIYFLHSLILT